MDIDEQFSAIIHEALDKAAKVKCNRETYRDQLDNWKEEIELAIDASESGEDEEDDEEDDDDEEDEDDEPSDDE